MFMSFESTTTTVLPSGILRPCDQAEVLFRLDKVCFARPWRLDSLAQLLERPFYRAWTWHEAANEEAEGFLLAEEQADLLSILRVGVQPSRRRQGIGRLLLEFLIQKTRSEGTPGVILEVHESNLGAQQLYEALGFQAIHRKKNYYVEPPGDALVMFLDLP